MKKEKEGKRNRYPVRFGSFPPFSIVRAGKKKGGCASDHRRRKKQRRKILSVPNLDPGNFPGAIFRWDPRPPAPGKDHNVAHQGPPSLDDHRPASSRHAKSLEDLFKDYGVRPATIAKVMELGFTVSTLLDMTEQEIDDVIKTMPDGFRVELLVGERYGFKSAIRAEKRRLEEEAERQRFQLLSRAARKRRPDDPSSASQGILREQRADNGPMFLDAVVAVSPLNLNLKEPVILDQRHGHFGTPALLSLPEPSSDEEKRKLGRKKQKRRLSRESGEDGDDRPREHPFIVTEPGELARGKKNGLDYLFDLYEQCARFLSEVQHVSKERGEKCPTKVTNQVFRHAKLKGASYINKPKMRHYVHCYALHCLDLEQSNHLRKLYKERGENVGAWRQACYYPLVEMARQNAWDIEGVFNRNEKLRIWYVPTKLRQLCHIEKSKDSDSCSYE